MDSLSEQDGVWREIAALTWPQLLTLMCQFVIGMTDVWTAGQMGPEIQASMGLITQCQVFLMMLCMATVSGAVASVSQSLGGGKMDRARRYVGLVCTGAILAGTFVALLAFCLRGPLLALLRTPEAIMPAALMFFNVTMWALPGHYGMAICSAMFRSAKAVSRPLCVMLGSVALNVIGDLGFGLGWWGLPAFGARGIAWSTCLSVNLGAAVLLFWLWKDGLLTRVSWPRWRWVRQGGPYLLRVTVPALATSALWQTGYLVLFIITASLPEGRVPALAGLTAGLRIEGLLFMPAVAFGMTGGVLSGRSLGRADSAGARRIARHILVIGCGTMSLVGAGLWPARHILAAFLTPDPSVQIQTVSYLTYNILAVPFSVASIILSGVFNGSGATVYPMRAFSLSVWCVRLPLAWYLGHVLWRSASGVFMAMLVSQAVQSMCLLLVFLFCDWTRFSMRSMSASRARTGRL